MSKAENTLKPTIDTGVGGESLVAVPATDDMIESPEELTRWPLLRDRLIACQAILVEPYTNADALALKHQKHHRLLTLIAAICGTIAVLFAIVEMSERWAEHLPRHLEMAAAGAALVAVILGLFAARHTHWLLERHKSERCRLLKFRYLTDPALWDRNNPAFEQQTHFLRERTQAIDALTLPAFHCWIAEDEVPEMPPIPIEAVIPQDTLSQLVDYYQQKRLAVQKNFFLSRAEDDPALDRYTKYLVPAFFFGSVLAALGHYVYDIVTSARGLHADSMLLILLAAALPVLGSGVRTVRSAREFPRNKTRYRAKLVALDRLSERLQEETNPEAIFRDVWCCEQILESEHREFLRLMIDAEWFG
jgi:hypothetical protein